jgi:hypothetical protein
MMGAPEARTIIRYEGKPHPVINLCSYNYLGLANHPEVIAAAHDALTTHGLGACGSPTLSGMSDLHRELERKVAQFLGRENAMLFNSGFGGALTLARWQDQIPSDTDVTVVFGAPSRIAQMVEKCGDAGAAALIWPDRDRAPDQVRSRVALECTTAATVLLGPASRLDMGPDPDPGVRG